MTKIFVNFQVFSFNFFNIGFNFCCLLLIIIGHFNSAFLIIVVHVFNTMLMSFEHFTVSMLKPAELVWDTIEDLLYHDGLHDNNHHMENEEKGTDKGGVKPGPASIIASQEVRSVENDTGKKLNHCYNN
jgi:hypothetical protein